MNDEKISKISGKGRKGNERDILRKEIEKKRLYVEEIW